MTDVPVKQTGDTLSADEWNTVPTDIEEAEARLTALEADIAALTVSDITDANTDTAATAYIDALEAAMVAAGANADALSVLVSDAIAQTEDQEAIAIGDRLIALPEADRNDFFTGITNGLVAADEILALDANGDLVGIPQDVVSTDALSDLSQRWTPASASGAASLDFHEDTDNGANRVRLIGPSSTADITVTLPSTSGTLALSGSALAEWTAASASGPSLLDFFEDTDNGSMKITLSGASSLSSNVVVTLPAETGTLILSENVAAGYQPLDSELTDLGARWTSASASGAASLDFHEDTDNGSNRVRLQGAASTADVTVTLPAKTGTVLTTAGETLSAGFDATAFSAGTKSSGTYTPAATDGNFQTATNGGAHTLAPPSTTCCIVVQYTNNASAGAITTSGFTKVTGDSFTTTNGDDFLCHITKIGTFSHLNVTALQ